MDKASKDAAGQLARWWLRPDLMVRELFGATPDAWQDDVLRAFPKTPRIAMKASKGPGKTCVEAWCAWNFLLTRPDPNIAACSISGANLRDGLWKEMAFWRQKSPLLMSMFEWQTERIFAKQSPATWFMSARNWSQTADPTQLGNTLAGLHSDYIMFIVDESGSIPVQIMMSAEAALSSCREGHILQAGNTNTLEGALYEACVKQKHLWLVVPVTGDPDDPKRSTRINIEWARELIATRGRDDPYVKLLVLGEWPAASINALIGPEEVEASMKRQYQQHHIDHAARIFGVDVADEGDDASVIFPRQGQVAFRPTVLRNVGGEVGAGQVSRMWDGWKRDGESTGSVDACFIDNTGGWAGVWRSTLKAMNRTVIPVGFAESALDRQYFNRRAEMYFEMVKWIKAGGALPNVPELVAELTQTTYTIRGDQFLLEPKKLIKAKIGRSPDRSDALALTFAEPVAPRSARQTAGLAAWRQKEESYDPYASVTR